MNLLRESCFYQEKQMRVPTALAESLYFYVQWAGFFSCRSEFHIRRENMSSFLLLYTTKGSGKLLYGDQTYTLKPGVLIFLDCMEKQEYFPLSAPWDFHFLHISGRLCREYHRLIVSLYGSPVFFSPVPDLPKQMERILSDTRECRDEAISSSHIYRLLTGLIADRMPEKSVFNIKDVVDYIAENYQRQDLSVSAVARAFHFSRCHFSERFRRATGRTPHEYLISCRLFAAKELLQQTDFSIGQIAEACGFGSATAFSRTFREKTGRTPMEFRTENRLG